MKFVSLFSIVILLCIHGKYTNAQRITSKPASIHIDNTPELVIEKVILKDENNNNVVNAGEKCYLEIIIRNAGKGMAHTVNLDASLDNTIPIKGFNFPKSIYLGDLIDGEVYAFELNLIPQISMDDGFAKIKVEAIEANGFNSNPKSVGLSLHSNNQSLAIGWMQPWEDSTIVYTQEIGVKCCIVSNTSVKEMKISLNGEIFTNIGEMSLYKSDVCSYEFETRLVLRQGVNRIYLELDNGKEIVKSDTRTIKFENSLERRGNALDKDIANKIITKGKYYGLFIAIQDYKDPELKDLLHPIDDATRLKNVLNNTYEFDSINLLKNPTEKEIITAFGNLKKLVHSEDNILIFYAGHGYWNEEEQQGYWLPSNAEKSNSSNWIPNGTLRDKIRSFKNHHTLLLTDACFSGNFFNSSRSTFEEQIAPYSALYRLRARRAITSGARNQKVPDKSVFIEYFIKKLQTNQRDILTSREIYNYLREPVMNNTDQKLVPLEGEIIGVDDDGGDFIFLKKNSQ